MTKNICTDLQWEELRDIWLVQRAWLSDEEYACKILEKISRITSNSEERYTLLGQIDQEGVLSKQVWRCIFLCYTEGIPKKMKYEGHEKNDYGVFQVTYDEIRFLIGKMDSYFKIGDSFEYEIDKRFFSSIFSDFKYDEEDTDVQEIIYNQLIDFHFSIGNSDTEQEVPSKEDENRSEFNNKLTYGLLGILVVGIVGAIGFICS